MLKADPVETLARRNCESLLARYTALALSPSAAALAGRSNYLPLAGRFKCKFCGKPFATYQALGGHTSSHAKHSFPVQEAARSIAAVGEKAVPVRRLKVHECSKCHLRFPTGQALGGHMRRHFDLSAKRKRVDDDGAIEEKRIQTVPFLRAPVKKEDDGEIIEEEKKKIETVPFSCAPEKSQVSLLDLNLPPVDEDSRNGFCS